MSIEYILIGGSFLTGAVARRFIGAYLWLFMDMESMRPAAYEVGIFLFAFIELIISFSNENYIFSSLPAGYITLLFHDLWMSLKE